MVSRNQWDFIDFLTPIRQGNKGAVAIQLTYRPHPTPSVPTPIPIIFTFVDSHLAAFEDHLERRNADFRDISRRLTFGPCAEYLRGHGHHTNGTGEGLIMLDIYASDFLLWMVSLLMRYLIDPVPYNCSTGR